MQLSHAKFLFKCKNTLPWLFCLLEKNKSHVSLFNSYTVTQRDRKPSLNVTLFTSNITNEQVIKT